MTATRETLTTARCQKIADRLREYSQEVEDFAADMEEGRTCDALFQAVYAIDNAAHILEKIKFV